MSGDAERFERACTWFMDLREQPESPEVIARWLEWCRADPRNRAAFERASSVWQVTASVRPQDLAGGARATVRSQPRRLPMWSGAIAAGLAVVVIALFVWRSPGGVVLSTVAAQNHSQRLPDGSTVSLGGASRVRTDFSSSLRRLTLERGEAYFKVAPDPARPFVVNVGRLRVTALGTAFNVRSAPPRVVIDVAEGVVAIERLDSYAGGIPSRAVAGQQVVADAATSELEVSRAAPNTVASWQSGRLQFAREPLRSVIASVNRYSDREIVLTNAELGDLRFTGTVFSDRIDDWLRGLRTVFAVSVSERDRRILITAEEK